MGVRPVDSREKQRASLNTPSMVP